MEAGGHFLGRMKFNPHMWNEEVIWGEIKVKVLNVSLGVAFKQRETKLVMTH